MKAAYILGTAAMLMLSACDNSSSGPISMSVIGSSLKMNDPNMGPVPASAELLLSATAQGLVSFDATDQIQPSLAERWIVTDDGLSYIFRIREATWSDNSPVTSVDVVRSLKRSVAGGGRNALRRLFSNVTDIIPMTGQVVEIRLRSPEPNFLQLLAQPELAILRSGGGTGPYLIHSRREGVLRLRPKPDPDAEEEATQEAADIRDIRVRAERSALAIARFQSGGNVYLAGGTFADLPLISAARPETARFKVDPAYGLFGLIISDQSTRLADPDIRLALSLAVDRDSLIDRFRVPTWQTAVSILPAALDSASAPAALSALQVPLGERRERARALIRNSGGVPIRVRVALPDGPGSRLLFASLAADWKRIGVLSERALPDQPADLILIDEVAPVSSAVWYLDRLSCGTGIRCSEDGKRALATIFGAQNLAQKRASIADADAALVAANTYIPLALPMRWSLVGTGMTGWRPSSFSSHAIQNLRAAP